MQVQFNRVMSAHDPKLNKFISHAQQSFHSNINNVTEITMPKRKYTSSKPIQRAEDPILIRKRDMRKMSRDYANTWRERNKQRQENQPAKITFGLDFTLYDD